MTILIPWELGDLLCNDPEAITKISSSDFWRRFLNFKADNVISCMRLSLNRLTVAEITLSPRYTAYIYDDEKTATISVNYGRDIIFEVSAAWEYCNDPYSAYCGMKTGIGNWALSYSHESGFHDECIKAIKTLIELAESSDKIGLPGSIYL
jgi:hypothetical protein